MSRSDRFLKACKLEKADCTPVWFMRQAGRYMKEYRQIREQHSLIEMFKTPELAAEITLQPVDAFEVDAAIIFSDILMPLEGMGMNLEFVEGEGPVLRNPVRSRPDVDALRVADPEADLSYLLKSIRIVRSEIEGEIPLIGFAGAPFTLAGYAIEGGSSSNFLVTKKMMYAEKELWDLLMDKISDSVAACLLAQVKAGAHVVQIFDSWAGVLSPSDYRKYVLPHTQKVFRALDRAGICTIHFGTGTAGMLPLISESGGNIISVDWRIPLDVAWHRIGSARGIQGNLDPAALLAPKPVLKEKAAEILELAGGQRGHIFNLGHGILQQTPEDSVKALVDFVHERSTGSAGVPPTF
jgi:uroporphyrinogen decarboxylase